MNEKIIADFHTHTVYSHGKGTPEQNVLEAMEKGLTAVSISEHGPASLFFGVRGEKLTRLRREVDRLNQRYANHIRVYMGLECNLIGDGLCDLPEDTGMFDVLLLGYHRAVNMRTIVMKKAVLGRTIPGFRDDMLVTRAILRALERYPIHILAHPGEYLPVDMELLAQGAAQLGVLLELNDKHQSMSVEEIETAAGKGAMFVANSDAHRPERVGDVQRAMQDARRANVQSLIVNTRSKAQQGKGLRLFRDLEW